MKMVNIGLISDPRAWSPFHFSIVRDASECYSLILVLTTLTFIEGHGDRRKIYVGGGGVVVVVVVFFAQISVGTWEKIGLLLKHVGLLKGIDA